MDLDHVIQRIEAEGTAEQLDELDRAIGKINRLYRNLGRMEKRSSLNSG